MLIITNNPKVKAELAPLNIEVFFIDGLYGEVLACIRRMVIIEHREILSHPLSGSLKPNETYYNSTFISASSSQYIHMESLEYIESAIQVYEKFLSSKQCPNWTKQILEDFAFVDFSIVQSTLQRMGTLI